MYIALGLMFVGIFVGRLLQNKISRSVSPLILIVICLLLFILGMELGYNDNLLSKIGSIGTISVVIALSSLLGSCVAAKILYKYIFKNNQQEVGNEE